MRIIVTGALGHIGSFVIRAFADFFPGSEIILIDNFLTQRYCSLFQLPAGASYRFVEGDVQQLPLPSLYPSADYIIHLAAIVDPSAGFANPQEILKTNLENTRSVAHAAIEMKAKLIFPSTTSLYGAGLAEEDTPAGALAPQSPYAQSKLLEEQLIQSLGTEKGLSFSICRLATIAGVSPGMRFHTAVNKFCWQAVFGLPVSVWKTALHQTRPYLDIRDAAAAFEHIIKHNIFENTIYNVATENLSVENIINKIRVSIPELNICYIDSIRMTDTSYTLATDKLKDKGFQTKGNIDLCIRETIHLLAPAAGLHI